MGSYSYFPKETPKSDRPLASVTKRDFQATEIKLMQENLRVPPACTVYAELIKRAGVLKEGFDVLTEFSKGDVRYMDPDFLGMVVLAPVARIASIMMGIMERRKLFAVPMVKISRNIQKKNQIKLQYLVMYHYTIRYLKVLIDYQPVFQPTADVGVERRMKRGENMHRMEL